MTQVRLEIDFAEFNQQIAEQQEVIAFQLLELTGRQWEWDGKEWNEIQQPEPNPYAPTFAGYSDYEAFRAYEDFGDGVFEPGEDPAPGVPF